MFFQNIQVIFCHLDNLFYFVTELSCSFSSHLINSFLLKSLLVGAQFFCSWTASSGLATVVPSLVAPSGGGAVEPGSAPLATASSSNSSAISFLALS
jgi:hypothetical protein